MGMSDFDRANVGMLLVDRRHDNFTAQLFRLIAKADPDNRALLALGFPAEVDVVEAYLGVRR